MTRNQQCHSYEDDGEKDENHHDVDDDDDEEKVKSQRVDASLAFKL